MRPGAVLLLFAAAWQGACSPGPPVDGEPAEVAGDLPGPDSATASSAGEAASTGREPLIHVDIPGKVAEGAGRFKADWSFDLVAGEAWSAHVHVIPRGQLVPCHHHPDNDELVFVAAGRGEWTAWWRGEGSEEVELERTLLEAGGVAVSPAGSAHAVRNRDEPPLATVVLHRPEFGQNWYLVPDEVSSGARSVALPADGDAAVEAFDGWSIRWLDAAALAEPRAGTAAERLYLVAAGAGSLTFDEQTLPLSTGTFVKIPPKLPHTIAAEGALELLEVVIPR